MFSLIWEVRSDKYSLDNLCKENGIKAKVWKKGDRISSKRNHTTFGFKYFVGEFLTIYELNHGISKFLTENRKNLVSVQSKGCSSEIDIGVTVDVKAVAVVSLSMPVELQLPLSELGVITTFTVMLSDD